MSLIEIEWCTPLYQQALDLRHRLLREPLGLQFTAAELDGEFKDRHFGWQEASGELVAVLSAKRINASTCKLYQMAVETTQQGTGVGRKMLEHVEVILAQEGVQSLHCHARETAIGFYEKSGYGVVGESFVEVTIPHVRMSKSLQG